MTQFFVNLAVIGSLIVSTDHAGDVAPPYLPDDFFISCGSSGTFAAHDTRVWIGDADPKFTSLLQIKGSSTTSRGADPIPYGTARITSSQFFYMFHLRPGPKLIRFHFISNIYFERFQDLFRVDAGNFTLLDHFSPSRTANDLGVKSVVKEFFLSVAEDKKLEIVFSAENGQAYAFINGIEITSVPLHLSYFDGGIKVVGQKSLVYIDNSTVMEIVHRVHLKTYSGDASMQAFQMWGAGEHWDGKGINKITWNISVHLGFSYLIRLHFCEVGLKMAEIVQMKFTILINEMYAASTDDVFKERGYSGIPLHGDHMMIIEGPKQQGKRDLSISLLSNSAFMNAHGPFTGFEIVKLSYPYNSLANLNPLSQPRFHPFPAAWYGFVSDIIWQSSVMTTTSIVIVTIMCCIVCNYLRKIRKIEIIPRPATPCRLFSIAEIKAATQDFNHQLILGEGGFGTIYKGHINDWQETVAIKRLKHDSKQGKHEFQTEIETLSELRHKNVISLIGYCNEQSEQILVYEYIAGGTLADRLYKRGMDINNSLSWQQRLKICIDAGQGLDYLHTGMQVIHRDVKSSNILLDDNMMAKIADFGLAKLNRINDESLSHVSTNVKGTPGYLDPNYCSTQHLTEKSDTYSFGVVLLEVLCGRPVLDYTADEDKCNLVIWGREMMATGKVDRMVDSRLREEIAPESLQKFMETVEGCLATEPENRPTMNQVLNNLHSARGQQATARSQAPADVAAAARGTNYDRQVTLHRPTGIWRRLNHAITFRRRGHKL